MNFASLSSSLARRAASSSLRLTTARPLRLPLLVPTTATTPRRLVHTTLQDSYEYINVEKTDGGVGVITLHRPKALNALCDDLFGDLVHAGQALDADPTIGCLVLTGSTKAFAAGADISEMKDRTFDVAYQTVCLSIVVYIYYIYLFVGYYVLGSSFFHGRLNPCLYFFAFFPLISLSPIFFYVTEYVCLVGSIYETLQAGDCGCQWILSWWWL